jgi:hypothetical protein
VKETGKVPCLIYDYIAYKREGKEKGTKETWGDFINYNIATFEQW